MKDPSSPRCLGTMKLMYTSLSIAVYCPSKVVLDFLFLKLLIIIKGWMSLALPSGYNLTEGITLFSVVELFVSFFHQ